MLGCKYCQLESHVFYQGKVQEYIRMISMAVINSQVITVHTYIMSLIFEQLDRVQNINLYSGNVPDLC